jgi:hypothetical protein
MERLESKVIKIQQFFEKTLFMVLLPHVTSVLPQCYLNYGLVTSVTSIFNLFSRFLFLSFFLFYFIFFFFKFLEKKSKNEVTEVTRP